MDSSLLHLSDPHFGTERAPVVAALLRWVAEQRAAGGIGTVVISGDITQRARPAQFARARRFVDHLRALLPGVPVLLIPGNHDIPLYNLPLRLLRPFAGFQRAFGAELDAVYEDAGLHIQLLNTVCRWLHTDGRVSAAQIARVGRRLEAASAERLRVVVAHQPVAVTRAQDEHDLLRGHEPALRCWAQAGADLVLGGHIHLPYVRAVQPGGADSRRIWVVQAGTAVSSRIRNEANNSFNRIRYRAGAPPQARVERWDYVDADARFVLAAETALELERASHRTDVASVRESFAQRTAR